MIEAQWIAVIVTLGTFVISHIVITVWWASRVNTLLSIVQVELKEIIAEMKSARGLFVTKEELSYRVSASDKQHEALWKQVDTLKEVHSSQCKNFGSAK